MATQLLEVVAWRNSQVLIRHRVVDHLNLTEEAAFKIWRNPSRSNVADEKVPQPVVPKAHNHPATPVRASVLLNGTVWGPHGACAQRGGRWPASKAACQDPASPAMGALTGGDLLLESGAAGGPRRPAEGGPSSCRRAGARSNARQCPGHRKTRARRHRTPGHRRPRSSGAFSIRLGTALVNECRGSTTLPASVEA
jgi:hypothetical protein